MMQCSTLVAVQGGWLCRSPATRSARAATPASMSQGKQSRGARRTSRGQTTVAFVRDLYGECGLELREPVRDGCWYGRPDGMSGQDVPIAVKGRGQESFSQPKERI